MALITATVSIAGRALVSAKTRRNARSSVAVTGTGILNATRAIRRVKGSAVFGPSAATMSTRAIRIVKAKSLAIKGKATLSVASPKRIIKAIALIVAGRGRLTANGMRIRLVDSKIVGNSKLEAYHYQRDIRGDLIDYQSDIHRGSQFVKSLSQPQAIEMVRLNAKIQDTFNQLISVDTASDWGLSLWEEFCELPADSTLTLEQRRDRIKLRKTGYGSVTLEMIEKITDQFLGISGCTAISDHANYLITVNLNNDSITEMLNRVLSLHDFLYELIPAHFEILVIFHGIKWQDLAGFRWQDLLKLKWKQVSIDGGIQ